ncbi:unnamed protein product [Closterium sp. Naga37s-1]|nr:unnamed protein product [Closterium sp. Naga37s-1]
MLCSLPSPVSPVSPVAVSSNPSLPPRILSDSSRFTVLPPSASPAPPFLPRARIPSRPSPPVTAALPPCGRERWTRARGGLAARRRATVAAAHVAGGGSGGGDDGEGTAVAGSAYLCVFPLSGVCLPTHSGALNVFEPRMLQLMDVITYVAASPSSPPSVLPRFALLPSSWTTALAAAAAMQQGGSGAWQGGGGLAGGGAFTWEGELRGEGEDGGGSTWFGGGGRGSRDGVAEEGVGQGSGEWRSVEEVLRDAPVGCSCVVSARPYAAALMHRFCLTSIDIAWHVSSVLVLCCAAASTMHQCASCSPSLIAIRLHSHAHRLGPLPPPTHTHTPPLPSPPSPPLPSPPHLQVHSSHTAPDDSRLVTYEATHRIVPRAMRRVHPFLVLLCHPLHDHPPLPVNSPAPAAQLYAGQVDAAERHVWEQLKEVAWLSAVLARTGTASRTSSSSGNQHEQQQGAGGPRDGAPPPSAAASLLPAAVLRFGPDAMSGTSRRANTTAQAAKSTWRSMKGPLALERSGGEGKTASTGGSAAGGGAGAEGAWNDPYWVAREALSKARRQEAFSFAAADMVDLEQQHRNLLLGMTCTLERLLWVQAAIEPHLASLRAEMSLVLLPAAMTYFHFFNCAALSFAPHLIFYKATPLSEYGTWTASLKAALVFFAAMLLKMILWASLLPEFDHDPALAAPSHLDARQEALRAVIGAGVDLAGMRYALVHVSHRNMAFEHKFQAVGLGWALAESVSKRLVPLWVGAGGMEFKWDFLLDALSSNIELVSTVTLAALASLLWLRRSKPPALVPLIYIVASLLAALPFSSRSAHALLSPLLPTCIPTTPPCCPVTLTTNAFWSTDWGGSRTRWQVRTWQHALWRQSSHGASSPPAHANQRLLDTVPSPSPPAVAVLGW